MKNKQEYLDNLKNDMESPSMNVSIEDEDLLRLKLENTVVADEDIIYFTPFQYGVVIENPFKRDKRLSNIDYPYQISKRVISMIEVPEGYDIELPESTAVALPENGGRFTYSVNRQGSNVTIMSQFNLKKTLFSPKDYDVIKQFYQLMADKNTEPVVFKKL